MEQTTISPGDSSPKRKEEEDEEEDNKDQFEKKSRAEDERGVKRSSDEREALAKKIRTTAEKRAEESENPEGGVDINHFHVAREIGAASMGKSNAKLDERCASSSIARGEI